MTVVAPTKSASTFVSWIAKNKFTEGRVSFSLWLFKLAKMKKSIPDMSLPWNL